MANNLFPLICHVICKQVLPHAALGARHFSHLTLHLSSYSVKLPLAPGCRFPPCRAQGRWSNSPSSGKLPNIDKMQIREKESGRPQVLQASCRTLHEGMSVQAAAFEPSHKHQQCCYFSWRWKDSSPAHPASPPFTAPERSRPCCKQGAPRHITDTKDSNGHNQSTDKCKATGTPSKAYCTSG